MSVFNIIVWCSQPRARVIRLLSCFFTFLCVFATWAEDDSQTSSAAQAVFERVRPYVFQIKTAIHPDSPKASYGSGFVIDANGLLITNYHVVSEAVQEPKKYKMFLIEGSESHPAEILGVDVIHDLALIKVSKKFAGSLKFSSSMPRQGAKIFSIGVPADLNMSITEGNYNGILSHGPYESVHMANPINSGMSGGPTVNRYGRIIGVNVSVLLSAQNISFAVPMKFATRLLKIARNKQKSSIEQLQKQIESQLVANQKSIFEDYKDYLSKDLTIPGWKLRAPSKILKCWTTNRDEEKQTYRSIEQTCFIPHGAFIARSVTSGSYEISYRTFESDKLNFWQLQKVAAQTYNSDADYSSLFLRFLFDKDRLLTKYDCSQHRLVNKHKIPMLLNYCMRGYVNYQPIYNTEFKFITMDKTKGILVVKAAISGFNLENIKVIMEDLLDSVRSVE